jgi:hypothetical protein
MRRSTFQHLYKTSIRQIQLAPLHPQEVKHLETVSTPYPLPNRTQIDRGSLLPHLMNKHLLDMANLEHTHWAMNVSDLISCWKIIIMR